MKVEVKASICLFLIAFFIFYFPYYLNQILFSASILLHFHFIFTLFLN